MSFKSLCTFSERGFILSRTKTELIKSRKTTSNKPRSEITKFSAKSRSRLRHFLIDNFILPDKYNSVYSVTLTFPLGISQINQDSIFKNFCREMQKISSFVWRKEIQKNENQHWHLILYINDFNIINCFENWHKRIKNYTAKLSYLEQSVKLDRYDLSTSLYRYISDHASKKKSYQIAKHGRHWGVVGRNNFYVKKFLNLDLECWQFFKLQRIINKIVAFQVPSTCVFGFKKSKKRKTRIYGRFDFFLEKQKRDFVLKYFEKYLYNKDKF